MLAISEIVAIDSFQGLLVVVSDGRQLVSSYLQLPSMYAVTMHPVAVSWSSAYVIPHRGYMLSLSG